MKPKPLEERIHNHSSAAAKCDHCLDEGWLVIDTRLDHRMAKKGMVDHGPYEEMAPCPFCEKGFRREFGLGKREKPAGSGNYVEYQGHAIWGPDGYWRGRELPDGL